VAVSIPAGTPISVRIPSAISSNVNAAGSTVQAELAAPLVVNGKTIASRGAEVVTVVANASPGGRVKGVASISLRASQVRLDSGQLLNISTNAPQFNARTTKKRDALGIGIATGIGSAIGAIAGKGKGAAIGAGAGAGAGTVGVLATRGEAAVIPAESVIAFRLRNAVNVP
jgi:hypothetical protein